MTAFLSDFISSSRRSRLFFFFLVVSATFKPSRLSCTEEVTTDRASQAECSPTPPSSIDSHWDIPSVSIISLVSISPHDPFAFHSYVAPGPPALISPPASALGTQSSLKEHQERCTVEGSTRWQARDRFRDRTESREATDWSREEKY